MTTTTKTTTTKKPIERVEMEELERILEEAKPSLSDEQHRKLKAAVETLAFLTSEIEGDDNQASEEAPLRLKEREDPRCARS